VHNTQWPSTIELLALARCAIVALGKGEGVTNADVIASFI
jgi:hypothetical protein